MTVGWERLLGYINEWASAREVREASKLSLSNLRVVIRIVEVLVSPADWDDYITTIYGTGEPRDTPLQQKRFCNTQSGSPSGLRHLRLDTVHDPELPPEVFSPLRRMSGP